MNGCNEWIAGCVLGCMTWLGEWMDVCVPNGYVDGGFMSELVPKWLVGFMCVDICG